MNIKTLFNALYGAIVLIDFFATIFGLCATLLNIPIDVEIRGKVEEVHLCYLILYDFCKVLEWVIRIANGESTIRDMTYWPHPLACIMFVIQCVLKFRDHYLEKKR